MTTSTDAAVGDGSELAAYAWLSRAFEPGHLGLWAYIEQYGAIEVAAQVHHNDAPRALTRAAGRRAQHDQAMTDLERSATQGIRLITPSSTEWPTAVVRTMARATAAGAERVVPPLAMWVQGQPLTELLPQAVSIVGARAATAYGSYVAREIAGGCACRGYTIISGGAFGIDQAAHTAAIAARGNTIAVLAGGIDQLYPRANADLLRQIATQGALVSEFPLGSENFKHRFLTRNRLVAGLTLGTVVVEAGARSGARATAARCRDLGLPLMAVPGPVTSASSTGCLDLLREEGTIAVGTAAHVLEAIGAIGDDLVAPGRGAQTPVDALEPHKSRILDAVPLRGGRGIEEIAIAAAAEISHTLATLAELELRGFVECSLGQWRRCRATRRTLSGRGGPS